MVDVRMKYQATIFGDIRSIEPTPDNIKTVIDLFRDRELIPTTVYELGASVGTTMTATRARLALADSNREWTITFLSNRIDIEKRSTERHGENLGELNEGDIVNLEFIPWKENIEKRTNCSISKNELIKKYKLRKNG